eukprot:TRINITY_DN20102_c0_g1_i1.p2 TRINITY_DN20102_c0_g1~~TRINITY_DN20102_c0_g1_i1.p2  ORF type:complete len:55 (+),score=6.60 TRINITY_DN20102_c0_g1_i1:83-247(+)
MVFSLFVCCCEDFEENEVFVRVDHHYHHIHHRRQQTKMLKMLVNDVLILDIFLS